MARPMLPLILSLRMMKACCGLTLPITSLMKVSEVHVRVRSSLGALSLRPVGLWWWRWGGAVAACPRVPFAFAQVQGPVVAVDLEDHDALRGRWGVGSSAECSGAWLQAAATAGRDRWKTPPRPDLELLHQLFPEIVVFLYSFSPAVPAAGCIPLMLASLF
jgi:hypothetical protein